MMRSEEEVRERLESMKTGSRSMFVGEQQRGARRALRWVLEEDFGEES